MHKHRINMKIWNIKIAHVPSQTEAKAFKLKLINLGKYFHINSAEAKYQIDGTPGSRTRCDFQEF
jgi:hypothetical protein